MQLDRWHERPEQLFSDIRVRMLQLFNPPGQVASKYCNH